MEEKENAPNEMFAAFIKEIRDKALFYADRAEWFSAYGETRMASIERSLHRFFLDVVSMCEYIGTFEGCCAYLREQEQDLFEEIKYYEEHHLPCPVVEKTENIWRLRKIRGLIVSLNGCYLSSPMCDKCREDHALERGGSEKLGGM